MTPPSAPANTTSASGLSASRSALQDARGDARCAQAVARGKRSFSISAEVRLDGRVRQRAPRADVHHDGAGGPERADEQPELPLLDEAPRETRGAVSAGQRSDAGDDEHQEARDARLRDEAPADEPYDERGRGEREGGEHGLDDAEVRDESAYGGDEEEA